MIDLGFATLALISSAASPPTIHVMGVGNRSCKQWNVAESQRNLAAVENMHWLTGLISGANLVEVASGVGNITGPDDTYDSAAASIRRYCAAHPTQPVSTAAQELIADMLQRHLDKP